MELDKSSLAEAKGDRDNARERNEMNARLRAASCAALSLGATLVRASTNDLFTVKGYGSFDLSSGYVLYGARMNDEPCYWTYGELSLGSSPWGEIGASLWQNTDMTTRRKESLRRMNEWDWAVFWRNSLDLAEDIRLNVEVGHVWYKYHGVRPVARETYHTMEEWKSRLSLENPVLSPYFEAYYDHAVCKGAFMLGGVRHVFSLPYDLSLTLDCSCGGGSRNYNACMYPPFDGSVHGGLAYAQFAGVLSYWFNEHVGVHLMLAFDSLIDPDIRDAVSSDGGTYANDFVWGTVGLDVAF